MPKASAYYDTSCGQAALEQGPLLQAAEGHVTPEPVTAGYLVKKINRLGL
jgi:hypothetical protein